MNPFQKLLTMFAVSGLAAATAAATAAAAPVAAPGFTVTTFASAPATVPATAGPDDIASLGNHVFVGWQNGVGTKGEPNSTTGQTSGTVVEYDRNGKPLQSWNLEGKVDGLGGDPSHRQLIATVNEDGNSSLYTIDPTAPLGQQLRHYSYQPAPDSATSGGVFTGGGTDAAVFYRGKLYLSASNPMNESATTLFRVTLDPATGVASLAPTFADNAFAQDAVSGLTVQLGLTDPDSNASVPSTSPRFAGQLVVDGQADQQLVFAARLATIEPKLTRLVLSHEGQPAGVDDVRWSTGSTGTLLVVDNGAGAVYAVTGPFTAGEAFASLDTVGASADNTEVDTIDLSTGALTPFLTGLGKSKGLLWMPHH
ncbi:MAG TPA: hypothetical protein VK707_01790 [Solirubrobacteraceae bacterium]|nr:hypothetical protein [Solirubrobacteraceae bacterium]